MTELNFKKLLQTEIDKVQGYVDVKKENIVNAEFNLAKDKNQLIDLEVKLMELLGKKEEWEEFETHKASKTSKAKQSATSSKSNIVTGSIKASKVDTGASLVEEVKE